MSIYYLADEHMRQLKNEQGENYWSCYLEEILSRLGVRGEAVSPARLACMMFNRNDVLILGAEAISPAVMKAVAAGLECGMALFAFAAMGADRLFGMMADGRIDQPGDDFTLNGYFSLLSDKQNEYLPVPERDTALPVFSPITVLSVTDGEIIGTVQSGNRTMPALLRKGNAYYFTFDLPKTMWVGAQGRPIYEGSDAFPVSRTPDARVTPIDYDTKVAFGDYYLYILQTILAKRHIPMLHRLPPTAQGCVPDLLLYIGGDDDATSAELDMKASEIMYRRGLPYHINLMPKGSSGAFQLSRQQYQTIKARGHELALHYDMTRSWSSFSRESFRLQQQMYMDAFGENSVVNVAHCLVQQGWAERGRYQAELGVKGDNGRLGEVDKEDINAFNLHGFGFGTSYPYFLYDDAINHNTRIQFTELPVTYYEPRAGGRYPGGLGQMQRCMDNAAYFGRTINLFCHPHYIAGWDGYDSTMTLAAIDGALNYCSVKGYHLYCCGPDALCLWWHDRAASSISLDACSADVITFSMNVVGTTGMIARVPVNEGCSASVYLDGKPITCAVKRIDGLHWVMVPVLQPGVHQIMVEMRK